MNIEDYREFCLSLGADVEEKLPFHKFKNGEGVLVFYVMGHMFSFFNCNDFSVVSQVAILLCFVFLVQVWTTRHFQSLPPKQ